LGSLKPFISSAGESASVGATKGGAC